MSTLHHEKPSQSPVRNFLDWCRAQLKSESEFGCCCDAEIERMARDIRMSASEFRAAASRGPKSADLLMRRMAALDLDPNEVGRIEPAAFRDLQRVCTLCNSRRRCARGGSGAWPKTKSWEERMNVKQQTPLTREVQPLPAEWGRLIQKLRWIGLDDEATRLESAISQLPPEERCDLFFAPVETD
jgi:hypothetical protein